MESPPQPGQAFRFAVSASQPRRQQIGRLWRALKAHSTVVVTGLGQALPNVVDFVDSLKTKNLVTVESIRTSSITHPEKRPKTPQLDITISLQTPRVLSENRQKQIKSLFKALAASKSGRVSVNDVMQLELSKVVASTPESDLAHAINHLMVLDTYNDGHVDVKDWQAYITSLCSDTMDDEQFTNIVKHIESKVQVQAQS